MPTPTPTPDPEPIPARDGALLFCGLPAVDAETGLWDQTLLPEIMDLLAQNGLSAAFFLAEEEILVGAETAREICARGFSPGILLTDGESPLAQARRIADLYAQILHTRVRLVCAAGLELTEGQKLALEADGFLLWEADAAPVTEAMTAARLNQTIRRLLEHAETALVLQLPAARVVADALATLSEALTQQNYTLRPVTDWTKPF